MATQTSRYLDYLPGIFSEDPFLAAFLAPFEKVGAGFHALLSEIDRYFDPARTDADFLPWLATWVALALDEGWDEAKRRQLIAEAIDLYRWRGTVRGLKRYLEIYTGMVPDIREWAWPAGLQIGVASQIGGLEPADASLSAIEAMVRRAPPVAYDYYVVDTVAGAGDPAPAIAGRPLRLYYRADRIERVQVNDDGSVDLWRFPPGGGPSVQIHRAPAAITRRDGLPDSLYTLRTPECSEVKFIGDTFLVDEIAEERPYRFVVDVRVPEADVKKIQLDKVRAILDLEKPAHTVYYLKLTPVPSTLALLPIQVEVRSTVERDTTVG